MGLLTQVTVAIKNEFPRGGTLQQAAIKADVQDAGMALHER